MLNKKCQNGKDEMGKSTKRKFSIVAILIFTISTAVIASVAITAYNTYIRTSKEKIALNFAAMVAQSASAYYAQNDIAPYWIIDLHVISPSGYIAWIGSTNVTVEGDGCTAGYTSIDLDPQVVSWR